MNPQEINKRIAIACGWDRFCTYEVNGKVVNYGHPPNDDKYYESPIPNYYEDLNAMYDAESYIMDESSIEYEKWLRKFSCIWHVKASKRAEAFLRTIGKWEDEWKMPKAGSVTESSSGSMRMNKTSF